MELSVCDSLYSPPIFFSGSLPDACQSAFQSTTIEEVRLVLSFQ